MILSVRKALNFIDRDDQQSFRKYLRWIYENEEKRTSYGMFLTAEFFQLSAKITKTFILSS